MAKVYGNITIKPKNDKTAKHKRIATVWDNGGWYSVQFMFNPKEEFGEVDIREINLADYFVNFYPKADRKLPPDAVLVEDLPALPDDLL